ncbi:hypothetical protein [Nocardioides montaniterrae]
MPNVRLTIDGREVSVHDTVRLFQADPFPGGHWYELIIGEVRGWPWDRLEQTTDPRPVDQRDLLLALEALVAVEPGEGSPPAAFALNTVAAVEVRQGEIRLSGVCSPIVAEGADKG